mmetsp:Transcript_7917/g.12252  ORF Transcript_7917/g.12252 Transcript_7917/m.12252 type:complete len:84 (+) Transcript_7917:452-703(+)
MGVLMVKATKLTLEQIYTQQKYNTKQIKVEGRSREIARIWRQLVCFTVFYLLFQAVNIYHDQERFNSYLVEQKGNFDSRMQEK